MRKPLLCVCCMAGFLAVPAYAEDGQSSADAGNFLAQGPTGGIWQQSQLLGNAWGARSWLGQYGVTVNLQEVSEMLGNTSGGVKQTADYDGLTTLTMQLDTGKAFGWDGGTFNASGLDVHGTNLSANNLYTLQTASGIEADNGLRLWELWYDQGFFDSTADIKLGQQSLDQEFITSQYAALFVNTMFGWPMVPSADMLGGGPAYPLSSLGARAKYQPDASPWAFLGGVFDDNPAGINPQSSADPQKLDDRGTNFRLKDSPLFISEIQFSRPAIGDTEGAGENILPGTYKLGFWYDAGRFADQEYGTDGLPLATGNGIPYLHRGNYSIYAVIDQTLWRESPGSEHSLSFFLRPMFAPDDQNLINFSTNAGFSLHAPFSSRLYDTAGIGMGYASISPRAIAADRDAIAAGTPMPIQNSETFIEATYQYQVAPWWTLQPDAQYVFNPGGGVPNPNSPTGQRIKNETVLGLRTTLTF